MLNLPDSAVLFLFNNYLKLLLFYQFFIFNNRTKRYIRTFLNLAAIIIFYVLLFL